MVQILKLQDVTFQSLFHTLFFKCPMFMVFTGSCLKKSKLTEVTIFKNMNYLHEYLFPKSLRRNTLTLWYMHQLYLRAVWNVSSKNYNIFLYVPVSFQNTVKYEWSKKKTPCFYFNQNMCCVGLYIVSQ